MRSPLRTALLVFALALPIGADATPTRPPGAKRPPAAASHADAERRNQAAWDRLVAAEELVHALDPSLARIGRGIRNLELPDRDARGLFAASVEAADVASLADEGTASEVAPTIVTRAARVSSNTTVASSDLALWKPLFAEVDFVRDGKFGILRGVFLDEDRRTFAEDLLFNAHARLRDGTEASIGARLDVVWARDEGTKPADPASWRLREIHTRRLELTSNRSPLFERVLETAVPEGSSRRAAREPEHEKLVERYLANRSTFVAPHPHFTVQAHDRHPSVSVVDVDADGWDDLYVMPELGKNLLFVNQRDGTFRERAAELGLDVESHSASAIFADFDNDGDADVYIGRTLTPSLYLENQGGRFVDRSSDQPKGALPHLVTSLSAADYDQDGLLDLYASTYAGNAIQRQAYDDGKDPTRAPAAMLPEYLPPEDASALGTLVRKGRNEFSDLPGPPNVLLHNVGGGRFEPARGAEALRQFRNTYQSTWADFDGDGDDDVYLANDFAPNTFVRNDGNGRFTDITAQTGTADVGFGMGASFGDYDGDGRQDLYISNMYSKAGSRITAQLPVSPTWAKMARGNTLFRNLGDTFEQVSGQQPDAAQVEIAGWSWGGQFADFNNDGHLDLFVPNGYFTAPEDHALPVDI